jgi:hypothetical protein
MIILVDCFNKCIPDFSRDAIAGVVFFEIGDFKFDRERGIRSFYHLQKN